MPDILSRDHWNNGVKAIHGFRWGGRGRRRGYHNLAAAVSARWLNMLTRTSKARQTLWRCSSLALALAQAAPAAGVATAGAAVPERAEQGRMYQGRRAIWNRRKPDDVPETRNEQKNQQKRAQRCVTVRVKGNVGEMNLTTSYGREGHPRDGTDDLPPQPNRRWAHSRPECVAT